MESILPSEIARLVYGYLEEEGCKMAAKTFLESSSHLKECVSIASKGRKFTTKFQGLDLIELLELICELCCYVRSVECEMKTREVPLAEVLHQFAKILRLVNDSTPNKPLYLRFTVPNSPKKGRKTKPSKSPSSQSKSTSTEKSPTSAKSPSPAIDENPESPDDADPNEILFQCLLENKALHEKLAENINQVVATKCDSEPLDKILEKKIVETIINTTEQDPIFQEMIEELVGPIESATKSDEPKISEQSSACPQPAALPSSTPGNSAEEARLFHYNQKSPVTPETPRVPSCRNNFPGFSPPFLQTSLSVATSPLGKPLTVLSAAGPQPVPTVTVPALTVAQSSQQNQQPLFQTPFHGAIVTAYPGAIGAAPVPIITDATAGTWQSYTYNSNVAPNQQSQIASGALPTTFSSMSSLRSVAPLPGNSSLNHPFRHIFPRQSMSTIKIYNPAVPCQAVPISESSLENLLKQPVTPSVSSVKPKLPSKLPTPQLAMTRSPAMPLRTGGVRTRGGARDTHKTYGGSKRAKVLYSVTSASQNKEKDEPVAPAVSSEGAVPVYKIVVTPVTPPKTQDLVSSNAVTSSATATLHAFDPEPSTATERNSLPSIVVSQTESSVAGVTTSPLPTGDQTEPNTTPNDSLTSPKSSTVVTDVLPTSSAVDPPTFESSPPKTTSSTTAVASASTVSSSAVPNSETMNASSPAIPVTTAPSSEVVASLVNATPQQGSILKKNLRKRVSLSTPRKGSHVRTLEFATPPKSAKGSKKSFSSPKHKTPQSMPVPNKALESVKSVLFKTPHKKKKAWDADLRVVFSADDDIPTSVGLKRKKAAGEDLSSKPPSDDVKTVEDDMQDEVCQTREEIVSRIQKDVLDVIGEENIGDLSRISFGTNKSPDILTQTSPDGKTLSKSPGTSSVLDIGDIGIPSSTIKRLYPKHEAHRDENSTTSDSPVAIRSANSPHKRLIDSVSSKLFGTPPRTSSPCISLPATPSSVSLEAALIRECSRIESQNVTERPFKDIALTCPKPGENYFGQSSSLLPPPKGSTVFKTPAKSSAVVPVEMTPVSKIIHEETKVSQCVLLTPTIPATPDQMKNGEAPQRPEEEMTPPDEPKENGPFEPSDQTDSAPSRLAKTPSKTPQVRLRAKSKPRDSSVGKLPARKRDKKAGEDNEEFSKLIEECFQRATGAVFGPSEDIVPSPEPQQKKRNRKLPSKKASLKKTSGAKLISKASPDEHGTDFGKMLDKHESVNTGSENDEPDQVEALKKVVAPLRKPRGRPRKSAEALVLDSAEPGVVKIDDAAVIQGRQKRKTRKKSQATAEEVKLVASKIDKGCDLVVEPKPSTTAAEKVVEGDFGKVDVSRSLSSAADPGDAEVLEHPSAVIEEQAEVPLEVSCIRSPSPANTPDPCTARIDMDNYEVGYENHDGRLVCLRISPFLDFCELPRDNLAAMASRTQRRVPRLSSQSTHQVVSVQREERPKRPRKSGSVSSNDSSKERDSPTKNKRKKQRLIDSKDELNHSHKRYDRDRSVTVRDQVFHGRLLRDSIKPTYKYGQKSSYLQDRRCGRYSPGRYVPPRWRRSKYDRQFSHHKDRPSRRSRESSIHRSNDRSKSHLRDRSKDRTINRSTSHGSQSTSSSKKSSSAKSSKDLKSSKVERPAERSCDTLRGDHRVTGISSNSFSGIVATAVKSSTSAVMIAPPPLRRPPRSRLDDELEEGELSDTSRSTVFSSCRKPDATTKIFSARLNSPVDDESRQALLQQVDLDKFLSIVHSQDKK